MFRRRLSAALAFGRATPLGWAPGDSYIGRVGDGDGVSCELRLWSPWPDIVAIEAECHPPWPQADDEQGLREVAVLNTGVIGGGLLALAGVLRWCWSCPRPWLDLDHLA